MTGLLALAVLVGFPAPASAAITLPAGFQEQVVFSGLSMPMNLEFANDGRVFVAEKGGRIKVFDSLADPTPTVFADLSTNVHNQWDRGLLGLALAPGFPTDPWVYVLYTYDAPPGRTAPVWNDVCANANDGTCVVTGRLSRLQANGNVMTGTEQVLVHDWCQQYPSHSIGDVKFGADGMLYVTGGDGASFSAVDYGQHAGASNPCADPPGGAMTPPTAAGGALRSQDVRTLGDPTTLDGALLRLDPTTGAAAPGNPLISSSDLNARRIVSHGFRNPFRFTFRPGTNEPWIADVGWNAWEEIVRIANPTAGPTNHGWPCFEGNGRMSGYDNANLDLCETLYTANTQSAPYYAWPHSGKVVPNEACPSGSSSASGVAFYPTSGGPYPAAYRGALFFSDYSRNCIWAMLPSTPGGLPDPANIVTFGSAANGPVDLAVGPGGELYYADPSGNIRRIRYFPGNQPPSAAIAAVPVNGPAPLSVAFSGLGSNDPDPADAGRLTYQWDFTNDGTVDSTSPTPSFVYPAPGNHTARLTVTDTLGATGTTTVAIASGNSPPTAFVDTPAAGVTWKVGDPISFTGHATDPQQGTLPGTALDWQLRMQHCSEPGVCHTHVVQQWTDVASGSFVAPDHEYPSYLELEATATDAGGLAHSVVRRLDPKTVNLTFSSNPTGLQLTVGSVTQTAPFTRTVIQGSLNSVSAPSPQGARTFGAWSDGGAATHTVTAPTTATTYTATYTTPPCTDSFGYTCTSGARTFVPADQTVLALTGDDAVQSVALPFPMRFYGANYSSVWVDTNGLLTFAAPPASTFDNGAIPSTGPANLAVYPFWDDLLVDASASVRTAVTGTAPNRSFVVEWRNVRLFSSETARVSFEVVLAESGAVTLAYQGIDADALEQGGSATVGIENGAGTVALPYSVNQPVLRSGNGVTFTPPAAPPAPTPGTIQGTVTNASTGAPVVGATVSRSGGGATTTTGPTGGYTLNDVPPGPYTVTASTGSGRCSSLAGSTSATVISGGTVTANVAMTGGQLRDPFGYTCSDGVRTFVPADRTVLALTGDDAVQSVALPFPMRFYGANYSSVWVDTNGLLTFAAPPASTFDNGAIPSTGPANLAVYPFWDDLLVDASASVRTAVTGTAPNRSFVVEWRNVRLFSSETARVSFEVVLAESGAVTLAYQGIDADALEQGGSATVGIENGAGSVALPYSVNQPVLRGGNGVTFTPPA